LTDLYICFRSFTSLQVLIGWILHAVTHLMKQAQFHIRVGKDTLNSLREAFEIVNAGDTDIFNTRLCRSCRTLFQDVLASLSPKYIPITSFCPSVVTAKIE